MIALTINGKSETLAEPMPLVELLDSRDANRKGIAIGHNGDVVHRDHWHQIVLQEGDVLDIVHMVGGG